MSIKKWHLATGGVLVVGIVAVYLLFAHPEVPAGVRIPDTEEAIAGGEYLAVAGGCGSCHRNPDDGDALSGGLGIDTPFGVFYAPNITPDVETGIGGWQAADFIRAMKHGRSPDGGFYYPAFPYRSYAGLSDGDVLKIAAYLMSLPPRRNRVPEAETPFWLFRPAMVGWNFLADRRRLPREALTDGQLARGAYLARSLGHCGECHTPRNFLGLPNLKREFAGARLMDETIEAIDADSLKDWSTDGFDLFLLLGMKPNGEFVGGDMNEVIEHNTSRLTDADRYALAVFFTRHNP